jgi:hypothetical protein
MWPTFPPSLFLHCWVFLTGGCLQPPAHTGSSLVDFSTLNMVILLPKCRFTHDLHSTTSQKTAFFSLCCDNLKSYRLYIDLQFFKKSHFYTYVLKSISFYRSFFFK